jgi:hypothetical protein
VASHRWWRPELLVWWVAVLFMIGSTLFALGPFPPYARIVGTSTVAVTYFAGSIFFTSAGYLQLVQTINDPAGGHRRGDRIRLFASQPLRIAWWSALVQSLGTLLFNRSTYQAMDAALSLQQQERLVWAPDMLGSVAFMIASGLAWVDACGGWWRWEPRERDWRVAAYNLAGSIAFQLSAVAAFLRPSTGVLLSVPVANLGTFVGAVCFFAGARLLIPAAVDDPAR